MKEERARTIYRKNYTPPNYRVTEIGLEFKLYENETIVQSKLKIESLEKDLVKPNPLVLDGEQLELLEIKLDGTTLQSQQYQIETSSLTIPSVPESFDLEIKVRIHPEKNTSLEGLYRSGTMFCTQCEAEGFRRITYFPDRPDVMARYKTRIEADSERYPVLLSNGNLLQTEDLEDGRHAAVWEDPFPKPSYLFAMVAGNLECLEDRFTTQSGREVLLKIYVEPGNLERTHHAMRSLKESMEWDEKRFGREYDLDLFMIVAVDDFNAGAMENKGLNIFNSRLVLASPETATDRDYNLVQGVIAHEYFHNWTGNRVTCRDWFQLSLKEGLTVFRDQEFSADMNSRAVQRISDVNLLRSHQFPEDAGPMSHPVRPDSYQEINNFYTLTVYEKGAEVIRMMHTLLGEDGFRKGMDLYFERHDGQAVTCEDFVSALEDANDFNLKQFRRWYSQSGTPKLEIEGNYNQESKTFTLKVKQSCPDTPGQNGFGQSQNRETKSAFQKEAFLLPLKIGLLDEEGNPLPLKMEGKSINGKQQTLVLSEMEHEFVFEDLTKKPIPSLLRHFSAPVDLFYGYSDEELALISSRDSDEFNRWEAGQQLMLRSFLSQLKNYKDNKAIMLPGTLLQSFRNQLDHSATGDPSLMAQALSFPSESYLGEKMEVIDVEAVTSIRKKFLEELALELEEDWKRVYKNMLDEGPYHLDPVSMGRRKLKNLCLEFIVRSNQISGAETAFLQYQNSSNMTDTMGALSALNDSDSEERKKAMTKFEQEWLDEPLVLDKWFSLQATSILPGTLEKVKNLTRHSKFDRNNPNRIRSVIGAFSMGNFSGFHEISGNGYRFLAESVIEYDRSNPMVAARLAGGFNRWRKFDSQRQQLMQTEMERIAGVEELSSDVREIISKSLQSPELATSQGGVMKKLKDWFQEQKITEVECIIPDLTGIARGKIMPADKFLRNEGLRMPEAVFLQSVTGEWIPYENLFDVDPAEIDMQLRPDPSTTCVVPWVEEPTAQVIHDCIHHDGTPVELSPRNVLKRVLKKYEEIGLKPMVAPELEFYLTKINKDPDYPLTPPVGRSGREEVTGQFYGIDALNEFDPLFEEMYDFCEAQGLDIDALTHESGSAQMEINFNHGDPLRLADHVYLFKRTMRETSIRHKVYATFMAKPMEDQPGSSLHIHQSILDVENQKNIFSNQRGQDSKKLRHFIGGLQKYLPLAMPMLGPNVNSYRRLVPDNSAPINVHWGHDNRTTGFRIPISEKQNRRVENRIAGADANPYLAFATSLGCGLQGIIEKIEPTPPVKGSAYEHDFALPRSLEEALREMQESKVLQDLFTEKFVRVYCSLKEEEYNAFFRVISTWEREYLLLNV